ncbi:MAG: galactose mutarotase [Alphaproteobacteria bacterium]|nr:galactose mutarotase [Alphaproteobacteria bacterium]MBV9861850.1 galactose mutarotase [Alphaproteobacteria bacterium]
MLAGQPAPLQPFGESPDRRNAMLCTLQNDRLRVGITDFGGRIVSLEAPDRHGRRDHVVLGFDSVSDYLQAGGAFGALLGRNANRIAAGRFAIDGRGYQVATNDRGATLHGGPVGFDKVFWRVVRASGDELLLVHTSPDGDQGFPGELSVEAVYRLDGDSLTLEMTAVTNAPTVVSLSAHPYFNLAGAEAGDILGHEVTIAAESFLPTNQTQIPTGEIRPVDGTVFDFRRPVALGARIRKADPQLLHGQGYDHYYVLGAPPGGEAQFAARARDPVSGRVLEIYTTQPGTQLYTGNQLNGSVSGRGGVVYRQSAGFAFEPQGFPDAPNHSNFPSTILRPGARYREIIRYRFSAD